MQTKRSASKPVSAIGVLMVIAVLAYTVLAKRQPSPVPSPSASTPAAERRGSDASREVATRNSIGTNGPTAPNSPSPPASHGSSPPAPVPASTASQIRIGAWNIEWLGKPEDRSGRGKGVAQSADDLADYIIFAEVQVLALAEIVTRPPTRMLRSREIEAAIESIARRTGDQWDYVLFPGRAEGDQLTGVMWNARRITAVSSRGVAWNQNEDKPWALPIPRARSASGSALWNRPPHAMKFSAGEGKTDFVVIPVHMKADYNGDFASHRAEEAKALVRAIPAASEHFNDFDVVVLGDTNTTAEREPAIDRFTVFGLFDLNAASRPTHWQGGSMDRAMVIRAQPEFAQSAFEVVSTKYLTSRALRREDFKQRYSDHYMVTATVRIMNDDD